jgi:hypothetical protein
MNRLNKTSIKNVLNGLQKEIHQDARERGLWLGLDTFEYKDNEERYEAISAAKADISGKLVVCQGNLNMARYEIAKEIPDQDEAHPAISKFEMRLAEAVIAILDLAEARGCELGATILTKLSK